MAGGPEHTASHEVKVTGVFYRRVVVADGRAEDAGFLRTVFVHPSDDEIIGLLAASLGPGALFATCDRSRCVENMDVVVEFFIDGSPIIQSLRDRAFLIRKADRDRLLRTVAARLETEIFKPEAVRGTERDGVVRFANAIAVHRAVKVDPGDAIAMRLEHGLDRRRIGDIGCAFVVDDEIVAFGVIRISQDRQRWVSAAVGRMNLIDDDVGALLNALLEYVLLFGVIVAAAPGDQQNTERFWRAGGSQRSGPC